MNNTFSSFGKIDGPACREEKDPEGNEELYILSLCDECSEVPQAVLVVFPPRP